MDRLKVENPLLHSPFRGNQQHINPFKHLEDAAHGGRLRGLADLMRDALSLLLQRQTHFPFGQSIDQQRPSHHHH